MTTNNSIDRIHKEEVGKGKKDIDHTRELGENMPATMVLNWVKPMPGVLLENYNQIFCYTHSETTSREGVYLLETMWISLSQPLSHFLGLPGDQYLLSWTGRQRVLTKTKINAFL